MNKFKGITTHRIVSRDDLKKIMTFPEKEIDKYSNFKIEIVEDLDTLYKRIVQSITELLITNNKDNKKTKIILPVGPTPQYRLFADVLNKKEINLKNLWIFFMDEYLDWECRLISRDHPMSFTGFMDRNLFNLLDDKLGFNIKQVVWPNPMDLDFSDKKIDELGGIDLCCGGIGYHGHIAFNEPYNTYFNRITIEEFINSKTRIIDLNPDTFVVNSICGIGGNCYELPPKAITIGMKSIMNSKKIELYCDGGELQWQKAAFRIACMHPPTLDFPVTLLQLRKNSKNNVTIIADLKTSSPIEGNPM